MFLTIYVENFSMLLRYETMSIWFDLPAYAITRLETYKSPFFRSSAALFRANSEDPFPTDQIVWSAVVVPVLLLLYDPIEDSAAFVETV